MSTNTASQTFGDIQNYVTDTAQQYDIDVIVSPIGTGRNHQILAGLAQVGLKVQTVNAALYLDELATSDADPFQPNPDTQVVVVDEVSRLDPASLARALELILEHSGSVPFILSEATHYAHTSETIYERLAPLFASDTGRTVHEA